MSKPYRPECEYWQWIIDLNKVNVARCNHPKSKDGKCIKGKCPDARK